MESKSFTKKILSWYNRNKRDLPWRRTTDPFHIWLSEVIMQQTRVSQGLPYYLKFVQRFKNVSDLALASEEEVLSLWQGLGYYSRGRNLLMGARYIRENYHGQMPDNYKELLTIKGVGAYTAAAVASIAFQEKVPCIDGNVDRVISRIFGVEEDIAYAAGKKRIRELSEELIPDNRPGEFNQAVMEFGALWCTPRNPACDTCIFQQTCYANSRNLQEFLPNKSRKAKKKERFLNYVLFHYKEKYLMNKRAEGDIWQGLYDFHLLEENGSLKTEEDLMEELKNITGDATFISLRDYRHILSHQTLFVRIFRVRLSSGKSLESLKKKVKLMKFFLREMTDLPKPVLINKYLNDEIF